MEEAATFAVCRMIRHDVSHQRSYKPSIGLPRSARAGQANARDQVSLRVEGQFPQRPNYLETSGIGQLRKDGFGYITVRKVQGIGDQDQPRFGERDAPQAKHHGFQHFPIRIEPQGRERAGDERSGEVIQVRGLTVDLVHQPAGHEVHKAHARSVAVRGFRKVQYRNVPDARAFHFRFAR